MAFDAAAVKALFAAVTSHAQALGIFERVNNHEPENAPGSQQSCVIIVAAIEPLPRRSGLAATSGRVEFQARIYNPRRGGKLDDIDPDSLAAVCALIAAYSADFTLGGLAMEVDLLGAYGPALAAQAGYLTQEGTVYRVMDIALPVIVDDLWPQEATSL